MTNAAYRILTHARHLIQTLHPSNILSGLDTVVLAAAQGYSKEQHIRTPAR
jgi:hypothetical protein